jgi:hypothetical protein
MFFDVVCLAIILGTVGVNVFLVFGRGLWVPYVDPVKYDYQLLPAFCWMAAALMPKALALTSSASAELKHRRLLLAATLMGLGLLIGAVLLNMYILQSLTGQDYLLFRVESDVGFSFIRLAPAIAQQYLSPVQGLGFLLIVVSLLWSNRYELSGNLTKKKTVS